MLTPNFLKEFDSKLELSSTAIYDQDIKVAKVFATIMPYDFVLPFIKIRKGKIYFVWTTEKGTVTVRFDGNYNISYKIKRIKRNKTKIKKGKGDFEKGIFPKKLIKGISGIHKLKIDLSPWYDPKVEPHHYPEQTSPEDTTSWNNRVGEENRSTFNSGHSTYNLQQD